MALNIIRQVTCNQSLAPTTIAFRKASNLYHPDYLKPPPDPRKIHKALCLHLEGFDYAVLEKYQIFAVKATKLMGLNVAQCYPLPHKEYEVERYKSQTQVIQATYNLKIYQRVIQVDDVPASKLCGWIRVLEASLPSGIKFQIDHHTKEFEDKRYIPNLPLLELKSTLQEITGESPVK